MFQSMLMWFIARFVDVWTEISTFFILHPFLAVMALASIAATVVFCLYRVD
jgi:hypothetical protein